MNEIFAMAKTPRTQRDFDPMLTSSKYIESNGTNSIDPYRTCCASIWTLPACVTRITPIAKRNGKTIQLSYLV